MYLTIIFVNEITNLYWWMTVRLNVMVFLAIIQIHNRYMGNDYIPRLQDCSSIVRCLILFSLYFLPLSTLQWNFVMIIHVWIVLGVENNSYNSFVHLLRPLSKMKRNFGWNSSFNLSWSHPSHPTEWKGTFWWVVYFEKCNKSVCLKEIWWMCLVWQSKVVLCYG